MIKKIALPIKNNLLGQNFEQCSEFYIITVEDENHIKKDLLNTHLQPGMHPHWLAEKGVTDIIANRIEVSTVNKFNMFKISVFAGVESSNPEKLVNKFLNGSLETNGDLVKY
jgi:predicted Fe-Mo cluster-binding NifX family protein